MLEKCEDIKSAVAVALQPNPDIDELLLAVEIVDISLNGIDEEILGSLYGYEEWFKNIEKMEMEDLKPDAIRSIKDILEDQDELNRWAPPYRKDRRRLLEKIEKRLVTGN